MVTIYWAARRGLDFLGSRFYGFLFWLIFTFWVCWNFWVFPYFYVIWLKKKKNKCGSRSSLINWAGALGKEEWVGFGSLVTGNREWAEKNINLRGNGPDQSIDPTDTFELELGLFELD